MSFEKNLGRVQGEQGIAFYPIATINDDVVTISWQCTDSNYTGELPDDIDIIPTVYYPHYNSETGILSWSKRTTEGLPPAMSIKGDKGDPGSIQLDVEFVEDLSSIRNPQEGIMYFVALEDDKYDTYIYESDINDFLNLGLSSLDLSNYYNKDEIDALLNNYYTKSAIDEVIGHVLELQDEILSIL